MTSDQVITTKSPTSASPEPFEVHDANSANWVVRKVVEARAYAQHIKEWAEGELRRAEREEEFFLQHYGRQLEDWARAEIAKSRRRKSIKLPAGMVGFRIEPMKLELKDDEKLMAWCRRSLPDALVVRTHIIRAVLTEHIKKTGECPDGAAIAADGKGSISPPKNLEINQGARDEAEEKEEIG